MFLKLFHIHFFCGQPMKFLVILNRELIFCTSYFKWRLNKSS
uniref:Uncharacterized protein n=1 Tax=Anguilla anguilla TaxID=7936 RepID=A0A0E9XX94_ANGAN